ncbi:hypothetical protein B0O99DRAFT_597028 [Bisporella sp. PMI_857]|nr:hypothetical protein B0O99DRAFT_597028 [Bisporella sp. PMI_857]
MEPFSITTGIFACWTAVELLGKCSKSLYRSGRRVKGAKDDIAEFASGVDLFACLIGAACTALERYTAIPDDGNLHVLQYLMKHRVLATLVDQSERVTNEIRNHVPVIRGLRGIPKLIVALKWISRKKDIEAMVPKMESVKCSFQLPRTKAVHIRTIEILQEKLEAKQGSSIGDSEEPFVSLNRNVQIALQDLGTSIVYERRVPGYQPPPTSPTASSINTEPPTELNNPHAPTFNISPSPSPTSSRNRSTGSTSTSIPPTRAQPQRYPRSSSVTIASAPEPRSPSPEIQVVSNNGPPASTESIPAPPPESDFLAVHENSNLLHLDPSANYQAEPGYITTPSGPLSTTAKLDENLSENLITQSFAVAHGLEIEPIDADENAEEGIWVQIGGGKKERCVGKVTVQWSMGADSWKREFPVHCWVCVHEAAVGDLVFGRRFVEKREHYWRGGRG